MNSASAISASTISHKGIFISHASDYLEIEIDFSAGQRRESPVSPLRRPARYVGFVLTSKQEVIALAWLALPDIEKGS